MKALAVLLLLTSAALARDPDGRYAESPHAQWFKQQHNEQGEWCCSEADGHVFYGSYKINLDGSVTAYDDGKTFEIEKHKVLLGPNPTSGAGQRSRLSAAA